MSLEAVEIIEQRVRKHAIACDWTRGFCNAAVKPAHFQELASWQQEASDFYGYDHYQLWNREQLAALLASDRYQGGLYDPLAGHIHPLNYLLGLARAARGAGVSIYEQTPVLDYRGGDAPLVQTEAGSVRCRQLVLACNAYVGKLGGNLEDRIMRPTLAANKTAHSENCAPFSFGGYQPRAANSSGTPLPCSCATLCGSASASITSRLTSASGVTANGEAVPSFWLVTASTIWLHWRTSRRLNAASSAMVVPMPSSMSTEQVPRKQMSGRIACTSSAAAVPMVPPMR